MLKREYKKNRRPDYNEVAKQKRALLSQNFIKNQAAAKRVIQKAGIKKTDTVIEIGPGSGALTELIAAQAKKIIAVEKDPVYGKLLQKQFKEDSTVEIRIQDFMHLSLPLHPYLVVANPPFGIFNAVVKKLLFAPNPPEKIVIFAQREAAERLIMKKRSYEFGVITEPWFEYSIIDHLQRSDFSPRPNIDVVILEIQKREYPLSKIADSNRREYTQFIEYIFAKQGKHVEAALKNIFTHEQWKRICHNNKIPIKVAATELQTVEWVKLFEAYTKFVSPEKKAHLQR